MYPRIIANLDKLQENAQHMVAAGRSRGISIGLVSKLSLIHI